MKSWEQMSEHEQLSAIHYDFYKDVRGVRPRWINYEALTVEEIKADLEFLSEELKLVEAREKAEQEIAIREFEELVEDTITNGARTRENALRWIAESTDFRGDWDYVCYEYGLPYGYFKKVA